MPLKLLIITFKFCSLLKNRTHILVKIGAGLLGLLLRL